MEIKPIIKYADGSYSCVGGGTEILGAAGPDEAYALWLKKFQFKGPPLPSAEKIEPKREI